MFCLLPLFAPTIFSPSWSAGYWNPSSLRRLVSVDIPADAFVRSTPIPRNWTPGLANSPWVILRVVCESRIADPETRSGNYSDAESDIFISKMRLQYDWVRARKVVSNLCVSIWFVRSRSPLAITHAVSGPVGRLIVSHAVRQLGLFDPARVARSASPRNGEALHAAGLRICLFLLMLTSLPSHQKSNICASPSGFPLRSKMAFDWDARCWTLRRQ